MPSDGNIDFTEDSIDSEVTIYDTDMNELQYITNSETVNLASGSYIVKIYNHYLSDFVTVYSPVLD